MSGGPAGDDHREHRQDETRDFHSRLYKPSMPTSDMDYNVHGEIEFTGFLERTEGLKRACSPHSDHARLGSAPMFCHRGAAPILLKRLIERPHKRRDRTSESLQSEIVVHAEFMLGAQDRS